MTTWKEQTSEELKESLQHTVHNMSGTLISSSWKKTFWFFKSEFANLQYQIEQLEEAMKQEQEAQN